MRKCPENLIKMITKMNEVGVSKIRKYATVKHPQKDHNRNLNVIRHCAKYGYAECVSKFSISRQRAEQILKEYYSYALEIEALFEEVDK